MSELEYYLEYYTKMVKEAFPPEYSAKQVREIADRWMREDKAVWDKFYKNRYPNGRTPQESVFIRDSDSDEVEVEVRSENDR